MENPLHCLRCNLDMDKVIKTKTLTIKGYTLSAQAQCYQCPKCKAEGFDESQFDCHYEFLMKKYHASHKQMEFDFAS